MLTLDSPEFVNLIRQSAALRGEGRFEDAIELVEGRLNEMAPDCHVNAYLEIIYAAQEGGLGEKALQYATKVANIDPNIPSVKKILGRG